jgi:hypothetical protein
MGAIYHTPPSEYFILYMELRIHAESGSGLNYDYCSLYMRGKSDYTFIW